MRRARVRAAGGKNFVAAYCSSVLGEDFILLPVYLYFIDNEKLHQVQYRERKRKAEGIFPHRSRVSKGFAHKAQI